MNKVYTCGGIIFDSLEMAIQYANIEYMDKGIILGIELVD